ncbi:MAG: hypothetical protein GDA46_04830 [Bdellovibrionales bacterium]|nr:hypothetical protein [Bdellovibrionales bacterium]
MKLIEKQKNKFNLQKDYEEFKGAIFTDTFQALEDLEKYQIAMCFFKENEDQKKRLRKEEIRVFVGNPPYNAGQKSENDNNQNLSYSKLDDKIRETYFKDSTAQKNKLDSYVRAIKWASEKIKQNKQGGVISFVSNASFLDGRAYDGLRKHLSQDFTGLYIFNLRGNIRKFNKKEGQNIFGDHCMLPIAISFLVKNPNKTKCEIKYYDIGESLSKKEKLFKLKNFKNILKLKQYKEIKPNKYNDWLNQRDEAFTGFIPLGSRNKNQEKVFHLHSLGVATNRDEWAYNFNSKELEKNMKNTIDFYNLELKRYKKSDCPQNMNDFLNNDSSKISWSVDLKKDLIKLKESEFKKDFIRISLYRPFTKKYLYFQKSWNSRQSQTKKIYPKNETKNLSICTSGRSSNEFSCLMTDMTPSLDLVGKTQCFPRYVFESESSLFEEKKDNISEKIVRKFQNYYKDNSINTDKIFFYIYGLLHSKQYVEKYKNNLRKDLAQIPMYKDFNEFYKIGKKLSDLHVNYEKAPKYKGLIIKGQKFFKESNFYKVDKMKHPKVNEKEDKTQIIYNEFIKVSNIPLRAYEYQINGKSAIKWIMSRYQVKTSKKSGIKSDPNNPKNPKYIVKSLRI